MLMSRNLIFIILIIIFVSAALFVALPKKQNPEQINSQKNMPILTQNQIIRQPAVAGQFYPADKNELSAMIDEFLVSAATADITGQPQILIVPHAGYVFSGLTAAHAFKTLKNFSYDTVIILGSSHNYPVVGLALYNGDAVSTPLGEVETNKKMINNLVADNKNIFIDNNVHAPEHSLEVQIPFLQKTLTPGWQVVLGLINNDDLKTLKSIAEDLKKIIQKYPSTPIVISSDLSHYPSAKDALYSDHKILEAILSKDASQLEKTTEKIMAESLPNLATCACGASAIKIGMLIADKLELTGAKLHYSNSGDTPDYGDKSRVVGYGAMVFSAQNAINKEQGKYLNNEEQKAALILARNTLELGFGLTKEKNEDYKKYPIFSENRGAFVTLEIDHELRGCIGLIEPVEPLGDAIIEMAKAAAFNDYRFSPLTEQEFAKIKIEISVLTPPQKISDPNKIELGRHGVIVRSGSHSGVFLPQVATETGWDLEKFMSHLCADKAGLPPDCWRDGSADIYTFEAQVMEEK